MGTINKQSVREEFDRLKSDLNTLLSQGKVSPECKVLMDSMITLFTVIIAIFLEKKTKKTSANSGKPSSQTDEDNSALGQQAKKGKGKKETSAQAANTRTVASVTTITLTQCPHCGEPLQDVPCQCCERRTRIDILFEKTVEHFDAEIKTCPRCNTKAKAIFPSDMHGPLQYGNGLKAYIIQLLVSQVISLKRAQHMIKALIGNALSESTLLGYVMQLHQTLAPWEAYAKKQLLRAPCLHSDETSLRVNKKNHWIHVYSAGDITLKYLHHKRGKKAMKRIAIIPGYKGVLVHDCWSAYLSYDHCLHALCGSHLLRELTFIVDANRYRWARKIKKLLQQACHEVSQQQGKCLSEKDYARLQRRYRNLLTRGEKELPPLPEKSKGKRGRLAKSDAHNLCERLRRYEQAILLFAKHPHVPFTNNRAEQDLRMAKVKQKVSGCFRVKKYAQAYCRISSYLQTMANKGHNPLIAVQMVLSGELSFKKVDEPSC